jgi:hypothetical protein
VNGETFWYEEHVQGVVIPYDCRVIAMSVRYMAKNPIIAEDASAPPAALRWTVGKINEGTSPLIGHDDGGMNDDDDQALPGVAPFPVVYASDPASLIEWNSNDEYNMDTGGTQRGYPIDYRTNLNFFVKAGESLAVQALEIGEMTHALGADASVTVWVEGLDDGTQSKIVTIITPELEGVTSSSHNQLEYSTEFDNALEKYLLVKIDAGQTLTINIAQSAAENTGRTITFKDSNGVIGSADTEICVKACDNDTVDGKSELCLESAYASITVMSDGHCWNII